MINAEPTLSLAEGIGALALTSYLLRTGWSAAPSRVHGIAILSKQAANGVEPLTFILPTVGGFDDERRRVADALRTIEAVEDRPAAVIAEDIQRSFQAEVAAALANDVQASDLDRTKRMLESEIENLNVKLARLEEEMSQLRRGTVAAGAGLSEPAAEAGLVEPLGGIVSDLTFNAVLLKKVDELELSRRTANFLKSENIVHIGDLVQRTEIELLRRPALGRGVLNEIKEVLEQMGLHLGMEVPGWPPEEVEEPAKRSEDYS
jgi:hypothetical protein